MSEAARERIRKLRYLVPAAGLRIELDGIRPRTGLTPSELRKFRSLAVVRCR